MPCTIQIRQVNGAGPSTATGPTEIRVIGSALQCSSNQIIVTLTSVTPNVSRTVPVDALGRFAAVLPLVVGSVQCGTAVTVTAVCQGTPTCADTFSGPLPCCEFDFATATAVVIPGSLSPSAVRLNGLALGCFANAVTISSPAGLFATVTGAPVDTFGNFSATIPLTAAAQCDDKLVIELSCGAGCVRRLSLPLACTDCARAQVSASVALPCTGTPATATVTLNATISIAAGSTAYFSWDYGDGSFGPVFQINNAAGTATSQYTHAETHVYANGSFAAELRVTNAAGVPLECATIPLTVTVNCACAVAVTITADPPGPCVGGTRQVTYHATVSGVPASGGALQWSFPGSTTTSTSAFVVTTNGAIPDQTVTYPATGASTTVSASITVVLPSGCTVTTSPPVTIQPCTLCCPTVSVSAAPTGCAPANASATFTATMAAAPAGCGPTPAPTSFVWTLDGPTQQKYQLTTTTPTASTSVPWTDVATNAPSAVQFPTGGNYSISVTAKFAAGAVSSSCPDATDTASFTVNGSCPTLVGPLNASALSTDPCTWLFSAQTTNLCSAPTSYEWTFHDGSTATTTVPQAQHTYPVGGVTTGITKVTLKSPGCGDQSLQATITVVGCMPTTPTTTTTGTTTSPPGGLGCLCLLLLWTAFAFAILSGIALIAALCSTAPQAMLVFAIIAIACFVIAIILLIIWALVCGSSPGACGALLTLECVLVWLISIVAIIGIVFAILGQSLPTWCRLSVLIADLDYGLFLVAVLTVEAALGCRRVNCFVPRGP
jgi:hypothetical protein